MPGQLWSEMPDVGRADLHILNKRPFARSLYAPSWSMAQLLRRCEPTGVFIDGWESPAYWQVLVQSRLRRIAVVAGYRSTLQTQIHVEGPVARVRSLYLKQCDAVVVAGEASKKAALSTGLRPSKLSVIPNSVDSAALAQAVDRFRGAVQPPPDGHTYMYVGQLVARKNVASLVDAWASIAMTRDALWLVGDGPELTALKRRVAGLRSDLRARVFFKGKLEGASIAWCYAQCQTLVLPSFEEVWGLTVNEGLSSGCHVVVSDRAGVAEMVKSMRGAYVTTPTSPRLAASMARSREEWRGWIDDPELLSHGTDRAAVGYDRLFRELYKSRLADKRVDRRRS